MLHDPWDSVVLISQRWVFGVFSNGYHYLYELVLASIYGFLAFNLGLKVVKN